MKVAYDKTVMPNPLAVLRKAGYSSFIDPNTHEESFIIRLTSEFYPRFHLYVETKRDEVTFNLHLDQKKPSYGVGHAHGGEYDGPIIEKEMRRIDSWVKYIPIVETSSATRLASDANEIASSKPWWKMW